MEMVNSTSLVAIMAQDKCNKFFIENGEETKRQMSDFSEQRIAQEEAVDITSALSVE